MKSLYELIKKEHDIVEEIRKDEYAAYCYTRDIEWCEDFKPDCNEKAKMIAKFESYIRDTELAIENSKTELKWIRWEIKRYFEELNE